MIYAAHAPLVALMIDPFFELLGHGPAAPLPNFALLPLAIIAIAVTLGARLRRVAPTVYGVLTDGRGL